jgi:decaprenylphospho-beta-D-ribofuranose 2-oxidase
MLHAPSELRDIPHGEQDLSSFTSLQQCRRLVYAPRDEGDLQRVFRWASAAGARVTFRSGGHSFDDQSLPDHEPRPRDAARAHIGVALTGPRFAAIDVDTARRRMTVGPGATWGDILAKLQPLGLVPHVTVTTAHATVGGTLSGDCLSRFAPAYGKEGHHVRSFVLITPDGRRHVCTPPPASHPPRTLEERLFCGVIGGLGYLGAVTSVTYELLHVGQTNGRIGVESHTAKYGSFRELATELLPIVRRAEARDRTKRHPSEPDSLWSALSAHGGKQSSLVVHSRFTASPERNRMPNHQPNMAIRTPVEWLLRVPWLTGPLWRFFFWLIKTDTRYVDDLDGFTFMMDGTVRAKRIAESLGFAQRAIQQTFIVPVQSDSHPFETADERLCGFLEACDRRFADAGVEPTLADVLYIPRDERFLLSASTGMSGFAVSFAFETSDWKRIRRIEECFVDLSETCAATGGRVYLVKNVRARPETLRAMYARTLPDFFALKGEVDPRGVLRNAFLERHFGAAAEAPGARAPSRGAAAQ